MKNLLRGLLSTLLFVLLCTCSGPESESVKVTFQLQHPAARGVLPNAADYPCFGLIVTGEGIPSLQPGTGNRFPDNHCPYAGASSTFVPLQTANGVNQATVEAYVPAGKKRLIQVVALEYTTATACPTGKVANFLKDSNEGKAPSGYGGMYEVGYTVTDLFTDTQIQVPRIYDSATATNLLSCVSGAGPGSLQLLPTGNIQVRVSSNTYFQASGGKPPYVYSKVGPGTINSSSGLYLATGVGGASDVVTVTDADGNSASTSVLTATMSAPQYWVAADSFGNSVGANVATWNNLGAGASFTATGAPLLVPSAVNGFPAVRLSGGDGYFSTTPTTTVAGINAMIVARLRNNFLGTFFCLAPSGSCSVSLFKLLGAASNSVQGNVTDSVVFSNPGAISVGSDFFVAEMKGDLPNTPSQGVVLTILSSTTTGGTTASGMSFALTTGSKVFLGAPSAGTLDIAEFVLDHSTSTLASKVTTLNYLKAKYQLQ